MTIVSSAAVVSAKPTPLWLASASPRRVELLRQLGVVHRQRVIAIDETPLPGEAVTEYVERMALEKARAVWQQLLAEDKEFSTRVVLAADTTVHIAGTILGKPADEAEFTQMMRKLSGATHEVLSAVAVLSTQGEHWRVSVTEVRFRSLSTAEIEAYWHTGEPRDKAGGYAIQGFGAAFIEHLAGSYSGVVGLPLRETAELLQQAGVPIWQSEGLK
jgi:septum formation protein